MNELEGLAEFQDMLLKLNSETIEMTLSYLINCYLNSFNKFNLLTNLIFEVAHKKRNHRQYLSLLCRHFSESRKKFKKHNDFKFFFISKFLKFDNFELSRIHSHVHFYYLCVQNNFLTEEEILEQIQTTCKAELVVNSPCIVYYLLLYFSPNLKEKKNDFYFWLVGQFEYNVNKVRDYSKSLLRHWGRLPARLSFITPFIIENYDKIISKEEFSDREYLIKTGFLLNSIEYIILNDDVDELQELIVKNHIDVDEFKCHDSFLVFQEFFEMKEIYLLEFASVFNSVKCFKFLILNTSKLETFYKNEDNNLMKYAIKGGNPEIIRILHQKNFSLDECLSFSFLFFHYDIFQWIWEMKKEEDIETLKSIIKNEPLLSISLNSLLFFYEKDNKNEQLTELIKNKISNLNT